MEKTVKIPEKPAEPAKIPEKIVFGSKAAAEILEADRKALANADRREELRDRLPALKEELDLAEFEVRDIQSRIHGIEKEIRDLEK